MQLELDYKAYQKNSETSKSAWENKKDKLTLKEQVYDLLLNNPLANHQIAETMNIPLSSVCARVRELQIDNKIENSGKVVKSKYGRDCVVWQTKAKSKVRKRTMGLDNNAGRRRYAVLCLLPRW
jgi:hypothetical protein